MLEIQNLQEEVPFDEALWAVMEKVAQKIAEDAGIGPFEASVTIVDDAGIRKTNREFRGIDAATDVLSFPMADTASGEALEVNPDTGEALLGDIVISLPRAAAQAEEYGHSLGREVGFLTAHGMLHLLGYDHETKEQEREMFLLQEKVLTQLGLERDAEAKKWDDAALVAAAKRAREAAYAPYSKYRVGAALLAESGGVYTGCNVENASFGAAICAERSALCAAVAAGERTFSAIAVVADTLPYPCGICRQCLSEFSPQMRVIVADAAGACRVCTLSELLPCAFGGGSLTTK